MSACLLTNALVEMSAIKVPINVQHYTTSSVRPFDLINVDFLGPFPDNTYVLVIIDAFTKWTELYHCNDATARSACEGLSHHFGRFGAPNMIRSDKGTLRILSLKNFLF